MAIPRGAVFHGVVTESHQPGSGHLSGNPVLALQLTSLDLGGQTYPLTSDEFRVKGPNKAGETVGNAVGAGIVGTIIGCAVGRGVGCAVGAGAGVAAGTAASAASSGPGVWIPAEALVSFHLSSAIDRESGKPGRGVAAGTGTVSRRPIALSARGTLSVPAPVRVRPSLRVRLSLLSRGSTIVRIS